MKTLMRQAISGRPEIGLRLLEWSGGRGVERVRGVKRGRVPELRIVGQEKGQQLFKYAMTVRTVNGVWETMVYAALAICAASALRMAFW